VKMASMNKSKKRGYKKYRGQGWLNLLYHHLQGFL
jgi:hypothetical protein